MNTIICDLFGMICGLALTFQEDYWHFWYTKNSEHFMHIINYWLLGKIAFSHKFTLDF